MSYPDFFFEKKLWKKGHKLDAGADEVGRGCFAGPVVVGCVVFPPTFKGENLQGTRQGVKIDDSKKLTARQREIADKWIRRNSVTWGIGEASVPEINMLGMTRATSVAFRRAIIDANGRLKSKYKIRSIEFLLLDAFYLPFMRGFPVGRRNIKTCKNAKKGNSGHLISRSRSRQLALIDGDEKSFSIASASIIAKVYRDKLMEKISEERNLRKYKFDRNKGYGTKEHRQAILKYGITRFHRERFVQTFLNKLI